MKKIIFLVITLLCWGKAAWASDNPDNVTYRLRLKPEQSFRTEVEATQTIFQEIMGAKFMDLQQIHMTIIEEVTAVDEDGNMMVNAYYESIAFETQGMAGSFSFDSGAEPDEDSSPMAKGLRALVGESFSIKYSPEGRVLELSGTDALMQRMIDAMDLTDEEQSQAMQSALANVYSEESLKEMFAQITGPYPPKPVGVGDDWSIKQRLAQGFTLETETTFRLTERTDGQVKIVMDGKIGTLPDGSFMTIGVMKLKYDLKGDQNGWYRMREATGWVDEAEVHITLAGEVNVEMGLDGEATLTWPLTFQSDMKITSTEVVSASAPG